MTENIEIEDNKLLEAFFQQKNQNGIWNIYDPNMKKVKQGLSKEDASAIVIKNLGFTMGLL
jgi:hypothetical protein